DRAHRDVRQFADPAERLFHLPRFDLKLVRVADVLISTPATSSEVWTTRLDSMRRRVENFDQFGFGELLFLPD
ncbi:MAG: hypothetical protein ACJ8I9_07160, partial [Chthoniobacterales bacterium]